MSQPSSEWRVFDHQPLERLEDNLWLVRAELPHMPIGRIMVIARRQDGGLVVHNPICVDDVTLAAIEALGPVCYIVVPNGFHRMDAPRWQARFPSVKFLAPRGARARVEKVVRVDALVEEMPADPSISFEYLDGFKPFEALMQVRSGENLTLVAADLFMNQPPYRGFKWMIYNWTGAVGCPRVPSLVKVYALQDKRAARAHIARLATAPGLRRVLVAHRESFDAAALGEIAASTKLRAAPREFAAR